MIYLACQAASSAQERGRPILRERPSIRMIIIIPSAVFTVTAVPNRRRTAASSSRCFGRHDACRIPRLSLGRMNLRHRLFV